MKKAIIIVIPLCLILAAVGFFGGRYFSGQSQDAPTGAEATLHGPKEVLYKMPLGKFVIRLTQNKRILHLLFDIDVYIAGAREFEKMNGAMGRAQLRDATNSVIAELASTSLWIKDDELAVKDNSALAEEIVRKLYLIFPSVRTAKINQFSTSLSVTE